MVDQLGRGAQMVMSPMCCLEQKLHYSSWVQAKQFVDIDQCFSYLGHSTWIDEDYIGRVFAPGNCKCSLVTCCCLVHACLR